MPLMLSVNTRSVEDRIVGIRFGEAGPIAYCSPGALDLGAGDYVVVRTDRGERLGWVVLAPDQVLGANPAGPMRVVDRLASEADVEAYRTQQQRAATDIGRAQAIAARRDQRVRVASLAYDLAGEVGELTFVAREQEEGEWLRREASRQLGVDLRVQQVGDRDRAKALGGIGQCGRALCCSSWQVEFPAISIKMAKDQGLAPNPSKISGVCGRLLCCLSFEIDAYREIIGTLPKVGKRISTPVGRARVLSINAITEVVRMRIDDTNEVVEMPAAALREQYGTAVRPVDLEDAVERPLHEQDRDRRDNLLAVLEPVAMPTAPRRAPPTPTTRERTDRPPRERPLRERDDAPAPAARPGIADRRPAPRPADAEALGAPRTDRPPRPERPPSAASDATPPGEGGTDGPLQRRRRRGRRGGRGRGSEGGEGGAPSGGSPAAE